MEIVTLAHGKAKGTACQIYLFGATLTSWKVDDKEMIFVASKAKLDGTKAIRGGIPICFPAFGAWPFGAQHGFARNSKNWRVSKQPTIDSDTGDVEAVLELSDTEETRQLWKGTQFVLSYTIKLSAKTLTLGVSVTNRCPADTLDMAFCFHTYLRTPDATSVRISGLKGVAFIDKTVEGHPVKTEEREYVAVTEFTDRVYKSAPSVVTVTDPDKTLEFEKSPELADYTVWNPWDVNKLGDMGDEDYKNMICVEATAFSKGITLQPQETWQAVHKIHLKSQL